VHPADRGTDPQVGEKEDGRPVAPWRPVRRRSLHPVRSSPGRLSSDLRLSIIILDFPSQMVDYTIQKFRMFLQGNRKDQSTLRLFFCPCPWL